ncbi:hypothetical protein C5167_029783 [Papaver somniferum]|nr:hypothetical protein C5167_029783 [Papaver somniferum]
MERVFQKALEPTVEVGTTLTPCPEEKDVRDASCISTVSSLQEFPDRYSRQLRIELKKERSQLLGKGEFLR